MAPNRLTDQQRQAQRDEAVARLEQASDALLTSDGWRAWLRTRSVLHTYSLNNGLLLLGQAHERGLTLTHVAGFKAWLRLGRCVRKGESALKVFAPMALARREDDESKSDDERPQIRFRLSSVFDVSQTDPLPDTEPAPLALPREPIEGDSHAHLLPALEAFAAELGFRVERGEDLGGAEGLCNHRTQTITLAADQTPNHQLAVLIHELAHALQGRQPTGDYARNELIVESTAFVVTQTVGLDTSCAAVPYINDWGGKDALEKVRETVDQIDGLARRLQEALEDEDDAGDSAQAATAQTAPESALAPA